MFQWITLQTWICEIFWRRNFHPFSYVGENVGKTVSRIRRVLETCCFKLQIGMIAENKREKIVLQIIIMKYLTHIFVFIWTIQTDKDKLHTLNFRRGDCDVTTPQNVYTKVTARVSFIRCNVINLCLQGQKKYESIIIQ